MPPIKNLLLLFPLCLGLSCQKVIDLQLQGNEPKYVIEGELTSEPGVCRVRVTRSVGFNEPNAFPAVSGALVTVKDNGLAVVLTETAPGTYTTDRINGTPGHTYELTVQVDNRTFTAASTMPRPVSLDTLYISAGPFGQFKFPTVAYTDPPTANNGYLFVQYVNGNRDPAIFWEDDVFTNGQSVVLQLDSGVDRKDDPRSIRTGDAVRIELLGVDENVLKYWYTLRTNGGTGAGNIVAPSNPVTNLQGGALGYFSAHTIDRKTVIAP